MAVSKDLEGREIDLSKKHFVIVPDKCSMFVERILLPEGTGAMDLEILSFERLYKKLCKFESEKAISSVGASMIIKEILLEKKSKLSVFRHSTGIAEKLYETISSAANSGLEPKDLMGTGENIDAKSQEKSRSIVNASAKKLNEIAFIWTEFNNRTKNKFLDLAGKMIILNDYIKKTNLQHLHIYIAGFDRFTKLENNILKNLALKAGSFRHYRVEAPKQEFGTVEFFEEVSLAKRVIAVAKRIKVGVASGKARYQDFGILASENEFGTVERILSEYNIPFFIDTDTKLSETEIYRLIELSSSCMSALRQEEVIALSKNFYLVNENAACFENFVRENAVHFNSFRESFLSERFNRGKEKTDFEKENQLKAENVRAYLIDYIDNFTSSYKNINCANDFIEFLYAIFDLVNAKEKTANITISRSIAYDKVITSVLEVVEILGAVTNKKGQTVGKLFAMFLEGLAATSVSLIAKKSDTVLAGSATSMRGGKFKAVFSVSFLDGSVPTLVETAGLINERDEKIIASNNKDKAFSPTQKELNTNNKIEVLRLFGASEVLFLAYSNVGNENISSLERIVEKGARGKLYNSSIKENEKLTNKSILRQLTTEHDLELVIALNDNLVLANIASEVSGVLPAKKQENSTEIVLLPEISNIFFANKTVSISRIQGYFNCPYKNFANNILNLKERDRGEIKSLDVGNFLHTAAEQFVKNKDFSTPSVTMQKIINDLKNSREFKWAFERNRQLLDRSSSEAMRLAGIIANSFYAGSFKPYLLEAEFGTSKSNLKTIDFLVELSSGTSQKIPLKGKIDRIDTADILGKKYARVIDYKSGSVKETAPSILRDAYYGTKLQLPLYALVAAQNGLESAGSFYFNLNYNFYEEEKPNKLNGFFNKEKAVLGAFDNALLQGEKKTDIIQALFKKDGSLHKYSLAYAHKELELQDFNNYGKAVANAALNEIAKGVITASPSQIVGGKCACEYCDYSSVCDTDNKKIRLQEKIAPEWIKKGGDDK